MKEEGRDKLTSGWLHVFTDVEFGEMNRRG